MIMAMMIMMSVWIPLSALWPSFSGQVLLSKEWMYNWRTLPGYAFRSSGLIVKIVTAQVQPSTQGSEDL